MLFSLTACLFSLLLYSASAETPPQAPNIRKRVVVYYDSTYYDTRCAGHRTLEPDNIPGNAFTHINFKYSTIYPETYQIVPRAQGVPPILFTRTTDLKRTFPGLKVYISVGGNENEFDTASTQIFEEMASTSFNRAKFIQQTLRFLQRYGFDGIDLNWEELTPEGSQNYAKLVKELRMVFKAQVRTYGLSITVPSGAHYPNYPLKEIYADVDFVNLMAFDFHSSSFDTASTASSTNVMSPKSSANPGSTTVITPANLVKPPHTNATKPTNLALPELQPHSSLELLQRLLPSLEAMEVDLKKFNLMLTLDSRSLQASSAECSIPGSGCTFKGPGPKRPCSARAGVLKYKDVIEYLADPDTKITFDEKNFMNYAITEKAVWISFDDNRTWREKMNLAERAGFGGIAIENIESDSTSFEALDALLFNRRPVYQDAMFVPRGTIYEPFGRSKRQRALKKRAEAGSDIDSDPGTIYTFFKKRDVSQSSIIGAGGGQHCVKKPECDENEIELSHGCWEKICCKVWAAPDPKTCHWRGHIAGGDCGGQCHGSEITVAEDSCGDKLALFKCGRGVAAYCCPMAQPELRKQCSWSVCNGACYNGYSGVATATRLCGEGDFRTLCCPPESQWQGCHWVGQGDCADNRCGPDDVQLARDSHGDGDSACGWLRDKALCCKPLHDKNPFSPVALRDLFPENVITGTNEYDWRLTLDHSAYTDEHGLNPQTDKHTEDPSKTTFGFFSMIGDPDQVNTIDKRDGSPYEVFDCPNPDDHDKDVTKVRKLRAVCLGDPSSCEDVFFGGIEAKLIRLPEHCTTNTYIRALNFTVSPDQELPQRLRKRAMFQTEPVIRDLYVDYNFKLAKRAKSITYRIDYSNQPGYWNAAVGNRTRAIQRGYDRTTSRKRNIFDAVGLWGTELLNKIDEATTWTHSYKEGNRFEFEETLARIDKECEADGMKTQMHLAVDMDGYVSGNLAFGISLLGGLLDGDGLSAIGFVKLVDTEAKVNVDILGTAHWDGKTEDYELAYMPLFPPYAQIGLFDIGPYAAVSASMSGKVDINANIQGTIQANLGELKLNLPAYSPHSSKDPEVKGETNVFHLVEGDTHATLEVAGSLSVSVMARLGFGIRIDSGLMNAPIEAGVEAIVSATATVTMGLSVGEDDPCNGGVTIGAEVSVEGLARIHGTDIMNWPAGDITVWEHSFIPYQSLTVGDPLCFPLSPGGAVGVDAPEKRSLLPRTTDTVTTVVGKAAEILSSCVICPDVVYTDNTVHRCLIWNAISQKWEPSGDEAKKKCKVLAEMATKSTMAASTLNHDNGQCNGIPYLETDPREEVWGSGDPAEEEANKEDSLEGITLSVDIPHGDEEIAHFGEEEAATFVASEKRDENTKKEGVYWLCYFGKDEPDLGFYGQNPGYPTKDRLREYLGTKKDPKNLGWTYSGDPLGQECGKVGLAETERQYRLELGVVDGSGDSPKNIRVDEGDFQVEHLFECHLLRDFFTHIQAKDPRGAKEWCQQWEPMLGRSYLVPGRRSSKKPELDSLYQRLYNEYAANKPKERKKEFVFLTGHLNRLKYRMFAGPEDGAGPILSQASKRSVQTKLRAVRDVISVMMYLNHPDMWDKFIQAPLRIHATLVKFQDPDNIEGFHKVPAPLAKTYIRFDNTDFAHEWQVFMGLIYWRTQAKSRSFCVTMLKEVDDLIKDNQRTPERSKAEKDRKAKIIEVAKSLRDSLPLLKLPTVVPDASAAGQFPMIRYTPTAEDKALYPEWDSTS